MVAVAYAALAGMLLGWLGLRGQVLTHGGAVALLVAIVAICWFGDWVLGAPLLATLLGMGFWARFRRETRRTLGQIEAGAVTQGAANTAARLGWALALSALYRFSQGHPYILVAYVGALAATGADAWATDVGVHSPRRPRLLISGQEVQPGTPGGVSALGTVGALGASWLVGFVGLAAEALRATVNHLILDRAFLWLPAAAMLGGVVASLTDSLLGSAAQGLYYCESCQCYTEGAIHECGHEAQPVRGWRWLTSDGVDLICSVVGAAVAAVCATYSTSERWGRR